MMNAKQPTVGYDEYFLKPHNERIEVFSEISAENRAFLVQTHAERWLTANRLRLTHEQVTAVEELILSISAVWYEADRDREIEPKVEALIKKVETVLPRDDVRQLATNRADHIPIARD